MRPAVDVLRWWQRGAVACGRRTFKLPPAVPGCSVGGAATAGATRRVDVATVQLIEKLALVRFDDEHGVRVLNDAIRLADTMRQLDVRRVQPMYSVLEHHSCPLRLDLVDEPDQSAALMSMAPLCEEGYYVAPPGDVILKRADHQSHSSSS